MIREYTVCSRQQILIASHKAEYFVNIFSGLARTLCLNNASEEVFSDDVKKRMFNEYKSNSCHLQVYSMLEVMRMESLMSENEITSYSDGLTKSVNVFQKLSPQCS